MDKYEDKNDFKCLDLEEKIILKWMVSSLFWDIVRRRLAICYLRFETTDRSHLKVRAVTLPLDCLTLEEGFVPKRQ